MNQQPSGRRTDWVSKVVIPIAVAVAGAVLVTALTPVGDSLRELLFPTKVTVSGSVTLDGDPAGGATLKLDGKDVDPTNEAGGFVLTGVGVGTHVLEARTPSSKPSKESFTVDRGQATGPDVAIELEPLARLGAFVNRFDISQVTEAGYDLTLWVIADAGVFDQIESVRYTLPSPFPPRPITVRRARSSFCYREQGRLEVTITSNRAPEAVVKLRNGKAFPISFREDKNGTAPSCPVKRVRGSAGGRGTADDGGGGAGGGAGSRGGSGTAGGSSGNTGGAGGQGGSGTTSVPVPRVTGQPFEAARAALLAFGFIAARRDVESDQPAGIVVEQAPAAGTSQQQGTTVTLSVSEGPATVVVPDVTGQDAGTAEATLKSTGLSMKLERQDVDDQELDGIVLDQKPAAGTRVTAGAEVTVVVGRFTP